MSNTPTKRKFHDGPEVINGNNDQQEKKIKIDNQDVTKTSQETNTTLSAEEKKRLLKERLAKKVQESKKEIAAIIQSENKPLPTPITTTTSVTTQNIPTPTITQKEEKEDIKFNNEQDDANLEKEGEENKLFFDPRIKVSTDKKKRLNSFSFIKQGRYTKKGDKIRQQLLEDEIKKQQEANQLLKKTLGDETIETFIANEEVPDIEWWDKQIMKTEDEKEIISNIESSNIESILDTEYWSFIEHPVQIKTMIQSKENAILPIKPDLLLLTKERKKMRKQRREEIQREKTVRILNGLEPPPENKVKLSNIMRVIGTQAIIDPTKAILEVTKKIEERKKLHESQNEERKLTPEQRKEKEKEKLFRDAKDLHCSIYKVIDLSHPLFRTKVSKNATDLYGTGCIVFFNSMNLVVFEAGMKAQKKFKKLMLNRIDWENPPQSNVKETTNNTNQIEFPKPPAGTINSCHLVWEGPIHKQNFKGFHFEVCQIESQARKYLQECGTPHYWDLIKNFTNE
ncbi:hypothetical protein DICPUDRAFT_96361 [Dictyostelium purpureum]|uniref:Uncharacterized protein n=1 Tax=Dictyostelium purpureum TaxID=5786 RepID=F0Z7K6_DICPU|nr:uncharacterized protein DICPUDRAFT_96361 [Dictyostelium purpureum]EGC40077.1 hypothetical protein DICPUDRAFT_96361 [Dictyostelium purpureum]|eukprot:XP_003283426.1 hypothetical protein DICPUDRAFT_96361 [Dictyostelium purpureum]